MFRLVTFEKGQEVAECPSLEYLKQEILYWFDELAGGAELEPTNHNRNGKRFPWRIYRQ